jgi:hypothetical protein
VLRPWWPRRRRSVTSPTGIPIFTLLSPNGCSPKRGILCIFRTSDITGRGISGVNQFLIDVALSRKFLRKWKSTGVAPSPIDIDVTNDSLLPLWQALSSRVAANLAVSSAEEIDRELEAAPSGLISAIEKLGDRFHLYRSEHRKLHLDQIEEALRRLDSTDPA